MIKVGCLAASFWDPGCVLGPLVIVVSVFCCLGWS